MIKNLSSIPHRFATIPYAVRALGAHLTMRFSCKLSAWCLIGLSICGSTQALADARAQLDSFLKELQTYTADFDQRLYDEYGAQLETASGTVAISRPGRFRWDYKTPYIQSIITDGQTLWVYDDDLAQVTATPVDEAMSNSPAQLLGRDIDIDKYYDVMEEGERDGLSWLRLTPKTDHDQYRAVRMGFDQGDIKGMRLEDNLGQVTEITFTNEARNCPVDDASFDFVPPPGVDVIRGSPL